MIFFNFIAYFASVGNDGFTQNWGIGNYGDTSDLQWKPWPAGYYSVAYATAWYTWTTGYYIPSNVTFNHIKFNYYFDSLLS